MNQRFAAVVVMTVLLLGFAGIALSQSDTAEEVTRQPVEILADGNTQFAFDLYRWLYAQDTANFIYSPFSISQAIAMVYAGARGETEQQIANALSFYLTQKELHSSFAQLDSDLTTMDSEYEAKFQLNVANSLWVQETYPLQPAFTKLLNENYETGLHEVDFANETEASRLMINDWVSEQTEEKIQDILQPGTLSPASRLVIANAIYFNALWRMHFVEDMTSDAPFYLLDGTSVQVPMMHMTSQFSYTQGPTYQVVGLDYQPYGLTSMLIVLPNSGAFESVGAELDADWFRQTMDNLDAANVNLSMPRFKVEFSAELTEALSALGMTDAFSQAADFSGIADPAATGEPLAIGFVIHKAFIEVDEWGTEAAAATVLGLAGGGPPNEPYDVNINRPFMFMIVHNPTRSILFMGQVSNPDSR